MDLGLADKTVIVTGATRGIGRAIALEFAREGARLAISAPGNAGVRPRGAGRAGRAGARADL